MRRAALFFAVVAVGVAIVTLVRHRAPAEHSGTAPAAEPTPAEEINAHTEVHDRTMPAPLSEPRFARRADPEAGERERSMLWDSVAPAERVEILRRNLDTAIEALETGDADERHVVVAEGALSALRSELYDTERGRTTHGEYEARLDRALAGRARR